MESELGVVLREQQAVVSLLLSRVALVDGNERRVAFEALARVLFAHLSVWKSVLLPKAGDADLAQQAAASGRRVAGIVARTIVEQQGIGARHDIQTLMSSVLSLLSQESALLKTAFGVLPRELQRSLAVEAEEEFMRLAEPYELGELPSPQESLQ
jgi:hypothetical protein